ncbi:MAG: helix-turn-helix transcriptional regulator [Myxococcales bacterium]|nr:helix-turn-helix transcriptional regulator [Myxococcales bacterium]
MARPADPHAHEALRSAARREFVKSGIQKARIEDITHACGLSKGAFYLHFDSKEGLFRELVSEVEAELEELRTVRERHTQDFLARHGSVKPKDLKPGSAFVRALRSLHTREDQKLLELLWRWRDVVDVLLSGSQGTAFDGVMWRIIDREVVRVQEECEALKAVKLMRDDIPGEAVGLLLVGTYLLVARRLSSLEEKPDFDVWLTALQKLLAEGTAPRPHTRATRSSPFAASPRRAPPRAARGSRRSHP